MIKTFAALAAAAALLTGGVASAAEVGIRNSAGYSTRSITGGHQWSEFSGVSISTERTVNRSRTTHGGMGGGAGTSANNSGAGTGGGQGRSRSRSRSVSANLTVEAFSGGSRNDFSGNDTSVFSESSVFSR